MRNGWRGKHKWKIMFFLCSKHCLHMVAPISGLKIRTVNITSVALDKTISFVRSLKRYVHALMWKAKCRTSGHHHQPTSANDWRTVRLTHSSECVSMDQFYLAEGDKDVVRCGFAIARLRHMSFFISAKSSESDGQRAAVWQRKLLLQKKNTLNCGLFIK